MALKDWKKIGEMAIRTKWWNKKRDEGCFIIQYYGDKDWTFSNYSITKNFKTKQEALKFAKQYMRTH